MEELNIPTSELEALALLEQLASFAGPAILTPGNPAPSANRDASDASDASVDDTPGDSPGARAPSRAGGGEGWRADLRYRSLVERLPVVTFMAGLDERMQELYISPQIEALLGFTQEEWLDNPMLWYRQLHPDDREAWGTEFARTCATGAPFRAEYRLLARDGRVVWVQGECQIIRDEEGRPLYLQGIAFDITHLKRAAQVEEARLAAEAASRAKSEFLARMSHEIRTPLNGVVGMIDLLCATGMTDVQHRYAQLAREAADSLIVVINDILDFSKIEAGKVEIEAVEFDLRKLAEDLTELLAPAAAKKKLALGCSLRPEVPHRLIGDPNRIRQVLTNLISNALKFTTQGCVNVRAWLDGPGPGSGAGPVGGAPGAPDGLTVRIQVEDTGIGIPADRLDRLFKSFSQVDTSTTRRFGGTGLGLAISKRLVELMGGEIGITSVEGQGTTFWFTLTLGAVAGAGDESEAERLAEALRGVRVLAVEPEPIRRRLLGEQLEGLFSPASAVVSTGEAVGALRQARAEGAPFEVALIPFGAADAAALTAAVRVDSGLRRMPLLAVADGDDTTDAAALTRAGFFARLYRPLTQSRLVDAIASATVRRAGEGRIDRPALNVGPEPLKGLHLLVAEDNEMNQFVTQEVLRRAGCTCDIVADGALAVEAVGRCRYDAVLMDCQMPGMDGLEAARRIRQNEAAAPDARGSRRVPIIALTADAVQGDREKCLSAGMDGYVTKPIDPKALFAAVGELVAAGNARQAALGPAAAAPSGAEGAAGAAEAPIDLAALVSRCLGDNEFAVRMLEKFRLRATQDVALLRGGVGAGDAENVRRVAHNLKAVAAHVGAGPLRGLAFEIERACERQDLEFAAQQLEQLDEEARRCASFVPEAVRQILGAPAPAPAAAATSTR